MNNDKLWTTEEVVQLLLKERERAVNICYHTYDKSMEKFKAMEKAGSRVAFVDREIANEARLTGNCISGGNALSAALGETMEDRIRKKVNKIIEGK